MTAKTYDSKCYELAEHFMQDHRASLTPAAYTSLCERLAAEVQEAVEDFFLTEFDNPWDEVLGAPDTMPAKPKGKAK